MNKGSILPSEWLGKPVQSGKLAIFGMSAEACSATLTSFGSSALNFLTGYNPLFVRHLLESRQDRESAAGILPAAPFAGRCG